MKGLSAIAGLSSLLAVPAFAQGGTTVESLLRQDYEVVGVVTTDAGLSILLESDDDGRDRLVMCVVAQTPLSAELTTQYCKPVR